MADDQNSRLHDESWTLSLSFESSLAYFFYHDLLILQIITICIRYHSFLAHIILFVLWWLFFYSLVPFHIHLYSVPRQLFFFTKASQFNFTRFARTMYISISGSNKLSLSTLCVPSLTLLRFCCWCRCFLCFFRTFFFVSSFLVSLPTNESKKKKKRGRAHRITERNWKCHVL